MPEMHFIRNHLSFADLVKLRDFIQAEMQSQENINEYSKEDFKSRFIAFFSVDNPEQIQKNDYDYDYLHYIYDKFQLHQHKYDNDSDDEEDERPYIFNDIEENQRAAALLITLAYLRDTYYSGNGNNFGNLFYQIPFFLKIFETTQLAEEFISKFLEYTATDLKIEKLMEIQLPDDQTLDLDLIHSISRDITLITDEESRNKFIKILLYYVEINETFKVYNEGSQDEKQAILSSLTESRAAQLHREQKVTKIDNLRKKAFGYWRDILKECQNGNIAIDKKYINLLLEIARTQIFKKYDHLALSRDQIDTLFEMGVGPKGIEAVVQLTPTDSKELMPDVVVKHKDTRGKKYFICKLSYDDIRGPFLGLATGCCQHLEGVGATAAEYGYTNPNSCFYVMFEGDPPNEVPIDTKKLTNKIVAQTWAWREEKSLDATDKTASIVFDSIESNKTNEQQQQHINEAFYKLAENLASKEHIRNVMIGTGGTVRSLNIPTHGLADFQTLKTPDNTYTDAHEQELFYDPRFKELTDFQMKHGFSIINLISQFVVFNDFIEFFISSGSSFQKTINDPNFKNKFGDDAYHFFKELLSSEWNLDKKNNDETLLLWACKKNHFSAAIELIRLGANLNLPDNLGTTPLLAAVSNNQFELIRTLINKGADVNQCDLSGNSPLLLYCKNNIPYSDINIHNIKYLLDYGANVNIKDSSGMTPLMYALKSGCSWYLIQDFMRSGPEVNQKIISLAKEANCEFLFRGLDPSDTEDHPHSPRRPS